MKSSDPLRSTTSAPGVESTSLSSSNPSADEKQEMIAFRVGRQEFCVDIRSVREIRGWTPATPLPHTENFMRGVINLRGAVLPIIDLSARLGFGAATPEARHVIIVVRVGHRDVGLLVDAVCDIQGVSDGMIQPTPDVASDMAKSFVSGIFAVENRMIGFIRLERVLPGQDIAEAA